MEYKSAIEKLTEALQEAKDHLDYCGYGDSWERECAIENGLDKKIDDALSIGNAIITTATNRGTR